MSTKQGWANQSGFIWAVLGSVVGFANVLSFSSQCYKNGGGAFLIPYFIAYLVLGLPMLILEGLVGQKNGMPLVTACGKYAGRLGKFIGWIAIFSCLTIGAFYVVLTSYSLIYTYFGATTSIPADTAGFFKDSFLHATNSITEFGVFSYSIFAIVALISIFTWWTLIKDISSGIEKICSFIMPLLTVLVVFFAIASSFLPGAFTGILQFISPDFSRLTSIGLWRDVFGQLFFSLSLGLGIITGYAQYNGESFSLKKAMKYVAIGDFAISFIAGWIVFACVGYMSHLTGVGFHDIVKTDSSFEIGFIIFPKILHTFGPVIQPILGLTFFFCIFVAGITGVFSIVESVAGNFEREFKITRKRAVTTTIGLSMALGTLFCFGNGQMLIGALAPMILGINMIFSALFEIVVFVYFSKELSNDDIWMKNGKHRLSFLSLKYIVPCILVAILFGAVVNEFATIDLAFAIRWSWLAVVSLVIFRILSKETVTSRGAVKRA